MVDDRGEAIDANMPKFDTVKVLPRNSARLERVGVGARVQVAQRSRYLAKPSAEHAQHRLPTDRRRDRSPRRYGR